MQARSRVIRHAVLLPGRFPRSADGPLAAARAGGQAAGVAAASSRPAAQGRLGHCLCSRARWWGLRGAVPQWGYRPVVHSMVGLRPLPMG
jgi:hypothetical protein